MIFEKIERIAIAVRDLDRSIEFFTDLGIPFDDPFVVEESGARVLLNTEVEDVTGFVGNFEIKLSGATEESLQAGAIILAVGADLHDPQAFAVRVVGDSMEPNFRENDIVVFSPGAKVSSGDDCFVRLSDPHETTFKQVFFEEEGQIRLQPRNHKYAPLTLERERVSGIWRAIFRYERLNG